MKNQKGFAVLEGLLILVIVGILAGTGWYVMKAKDQTDKTLGQTSNSSVQPAKASATSQKFFTITEWSVKAPYSGDLGLQYKITSDDLGETWAQLSSDKLIKADPGWSVENQAGGIIARLKTGEQVLGPAGQDTGQTIEQLIASGGLTEYSHLGDYYYYYQHGQSACSNLGAAQTLQGDTGNAFKNIAKNFQAI